MIPCGYRIAPAAAAPAPAAAAAASSSSGIARNSVFALVVSLFVFVF